MSNNAHLGLRELNIALTERKRTHVEDPRGRLEMMNRESTERPDKLAACLGLGVAGRNPKKSGIWQ